MLFTLQKHCLTDLLLSVTMQLMWCYQHSSLSTVTQEMTVVTVAGHYWHGSTWWKLGGFHMGILHVLHSNQCLTNNNAPDIFVPDYSGNI